jgi:23S rRNA pseudouridine1911/1915/1917 synthase
MARSEVPAGLVRPSSVPDGAILRVLRVPNESAGMRLDVFVMSQLRHTSRTRARAIVERSAYSAAGRRLVPSDRVRAGDFAALWREPFEDPSEQPPLRLEVERPGEFLALIHRIDRETSGLLMLARSAESERAFKAMLERRVLDESSKVGSAPDLENDEDEEPTGGFEKEYLAIVRGRPAAGIVELPLELDPTNSLRVKMRVAAPGTGLPSRTGVTVLETRGEYGLIRCKLLTGRQHQIRIHLAEIGHPLVGDKLYARTSSSSPARPTASSPPTISRFWSCHVTRCTHTAITCATRSPAKRWCSSHRSRPTCATSGSASPIEQTERFAAGAGPQCSICGVRSRSTATEPNSRHASSHR